MTDAELLDHIARQPHGRTGLKHLFRELRVRGEEDRAVVENALERLTARGDLIELPNLHYAAAKNSREYVAGRVAMHRDGYGFLIPDRPIEGIAGDVYLPRDAVNGAMNGDRADSARRQLQSQRAGRRPSLENPPARAPHCRRKSRIIAGECLWRPTMSGLTEWIEIPSRYGDPRRPSTIRIA